MIKNRVNCFLLMLVCLCLLSMPALSKRRISMDKDREQIKQLITNYNKQGTDLPVKVEDIAIADKYALGIYLIGENGGGTIALIKGKQGWAIVGGGGGALNLNDLENINFPAKEARELLIKLQLPL